MAALFALFASTFALGATVATDNADYIPGDTVWITGSGFWASEWVAVQITHMDTTVTGGAGHDPWLVQASTGGAFTTYWVVPDDDNVGESLQVAVTGQTSGLTATTIFTDHNTVLTITSSIPATLCPGSTIQVCANLVQKCSSCPITSAPLQGKLILFYINSGNCGVNVGQNANDSVFTDANGNACATLTMPTAPGTYSIRVKFREEDKPSPCPNPGNSACNPTSPYPNKRCVELSSSNDCKSTTVLSSCCTPPVITCPANIVRNNDPGQCGATATFTASATGNCGPITTVCTPASGSFFATGVSTVTCIATNSSGQKDTCSFTVMVNDAEKPSVSCPANITIANAPGQCAANASYTATASDNCGTPTLVCTPASGSSFAIGTTGVKCVATDAAGNKDSCSFTVTVNDNQKPTVSCPANITVANTPGQCAANVSYSATASDNCPGVALVCTPPSGTSFAVGTTNVKCVATDASGNKDSCSFMVTVNDTQKPNVSCPANIITGNAPGQCAANANYSASASDNCGTPTLVCTPASGSSFAVGTTSVKCVATDAVGNKDSCSFMVTVTDNEPPVASCPADITVNANGGGCSAVVNYTANVIDNCPGATIACTPASGSTFPAGTTLVTCIATDAAGKKDTCQFNVNVVDNIRPVVTCPANIITGNAPGQCAANVNYSASASDNCGTPTLVCTPPSGSSFTVGTTNVKCVATDASGNKDSCGFTVTVNDNQKPSVSCPANITVANVPGQCAANVNYTASAFDNCGTPTLVCTPASGSSFAVGTTSVKCVATDAAGNKDSCSFTVTVNDTEKPRITCPRDTTVAHSPGNCSNVVNYTPPTGSDNCAGEGFFVNCTPPPGSVFPFGVSTVTCVATDAAGNKDSCKFTVTITNQPPAITVRDSIVTNCPGAQICLAVFASDPDAGDILTVEKVSGPGTFTPVTGPTPINAQFCFTPSSNEDIRFVFKVTNSCGATDLDTADVSVQCVLPAAPILVSPANGATNVAVPTTLSWNLSSGGASYRPSSSATSYSYHVQLSTSSAIDTLSYDQSGIASTSTVVYGLDAGTTYYWRVNATGAGGTSNWSQVWTFTTAAGPAGPCLALEIDTVRAVLGADVEVSITNPAQFSDSSTLPNPSGIGGFSFLISYDCTGLQFLSARKGSLLVQQSWEYFTFRYGALANGNCGNGCPSCLIRIVAIADVNDGASHPNLSRNNAGQWVVLKFRLSNDVALANQCLPINWFWVDCTDNTVSDSTGNTLWVVKGLSSSIGTPIDLATAFPNDVSACDNFSGGNPGDPSPKKRICFRNGHICIPFADPAGGPRGDLNLNGLPYEPGDAVLYESYFVYGPGVWSSDPSNRDRQIASSDINGDGQTLTVADLVSLVRILNRDLAPLPKLSPGPAAVALSWTTRANELKITTSSAFELGGLYVRFKYSGTAEKRVQLLTPAEGMVPRVNNEAGELRVLIDPDRAGARLPAGEVSFTLALAGEVEFVEAQASNYIGQIMPVVAKAAVLPTTFELSQNYPNPFNPKTNFVLSMPIAGTYKITIYNLLGKVVRTFEGEAPAGRQTFSWDGTDGRGRAVSSGIYFYKAEVGTYAVTKKMVLMR